MKNHARSSLLALALTCAVALGACGNDPAGIDDHAEPHGVQLVLSGTVLASYEEGSGWTGELEIEVGEETAHIDVRFVDEDGDEIELEEDVYLLVEIEDEDVAEFEQDTPGEFGGHLHGLVEGETEAVFSLMHGAVGAGHADFVTTAVHVHVVAPTT